MRWITGAKLNGYPETAARMAYFDREIGAVYSVACFGQQSRRPSCRFIHSTFSPVHFTAITFIVLKLDCYIYISMNFPARYEHKMH